METFITTVTISGVDDSILPRDLISIYHEFPFVEFGVLLSKGAEGQPSFPSIKWIEEVGTCFDKLEISNSDKFCFAGHICGEWVKDIFMGMWPLTNISEPQRNEPTLPWTIR